MHAAVADALPDDDVDRRAWHLSESLWAAGCGRRRRCWTVPQRGRPPGPPTRWRRRPTNGRPGSAPSLDDLAVRLVAAAENAWAAGLAPGRSRCWTSCPRRTLPPELATSALELRASIAVRSGSVREAAALLERAAAETASPDAANGPARRGTARHVLPRRRRSRGSAGRPADLGGGRGDVDAGPRDRDRGGRHGQGPGRPRRHRGAPRRRTPPRGQRRAAGGRPRGVLADVCAALPARRRDWARAPGAGRRGAGASWGGHAARAAVPGRARRGDVGLVGAGRGRLHRGDPAGRDTGQASELAMSLAGLSWLESRTGQEVECRVHAAETLALCIGRDIHWGEAWALFSLGDLELSLGNPAAALAHLQQLDRLLGRPVRRRPRPLAAGRARRRAPAARPGRRGDAHGCGVRRGRRREGTALGSGAGIPVSGLVSDDFDATVPRALALHAETLDRFETARTSAGVRRPPPSRRAPGRRPGAPARGARLFTALGAEVWADHAATELDLTGERVPRRAVGGVASLTPQELQVALLLADGRTTREAAAALFLSPKTVEYHLRKVYTKLGIRSRDELAGSSRPPRRSGASASPRCPPLARSVASRAERPPASRREDTSGSSAASASPRRSGRRCPGGRGRSPAPVGREPCRRRGRGRGARSPMRPPAGG